MSLQDKHKDMKGTTRNRTGTVNLDNCINRSTGIPLYSKLHFAAAMTSREGESDKP